MWTPDEIIRNSFKILSRKRKSESAKKRHHHPHPKPEDEKKEAPGPSHAAPPPPATIVVVDEAIKVADDIVKITSPSASLVYSERTDSLDDDSANYPDQRTYSGESVYVLEEIEHKTGDATKESSCQISENGNPESSKTSSANATNITVLGVPDDGNVDLGGKDNRKKRKRRRFFRRTSISQDDRRRSSWLPCTCPQYKVSNELASRADSQGMFFAKVMLLKVVQLCVISLAIFASGFNREDTIEFFEDSHDWTYAAYGFFLVLMLCVRVCMSYRSRWPKLIAFGLMIPLTGIIAFTASCVTVIHNAILIPLITCTVLLTFGCLMFIPLLLGRFVMNRITNVAGFGLCLLCSMLAVFLKEIEEKELTYWDFISRIWLPAAVLSQIVVAFLVAPLILHLDLLWTLYNFDTSPYTPKSAKMSRRTPSSTVRQAMLDISRDRKKRSRSRSRERERCRERGKPADTTIPTPVDETQIKEDPTNEYNAQGDEAQGEVIGVEEILSYKELDHFAEVDGLQNVDTQDGLDLEHLEPSGEHIDEPLGVNEQIGEIDKLDQESLEHQEIDKLDQESLEHQEIDKLDQESLEHQEIDKLDQESLEHQEIDTQEFTSRDEIQDVGTSPDQKDMEEEQGVTPENDDLSSHSTELQNDETAQLNTGTTPESKRKKRKHSLSRKVKGWFVTVRQRSELTAEIVANDAKSTVQAADRSHESIHPEDLSSQPDVSHGKTDEVSVEDLHRNSTGGFHSLSSIPDADTSLHVESNSGSLPPKTASGKKINDDVGVLSGVQSAASSVNSVDLKVNALKESEASLPEVEMPRQECCFCSSVPQYRVHEDLKKDTVLVQTHFIQKVFSVILLKAVIMLVWLILVQVVDDLKAFYEAESAIHYHFLSAGAYGSVKLAVRVIRNLKDRSMLVHILIFATEIFFLCDFLGYLLTHWMNDYIHEAMDIIVCIAGTAFFFVFTGIFAVFDMRDGIMKGSAIIVAALTFLRQVIHSTLYAMKENAGVTERLLGTLFSLGFVELIIMVIMFELKNIVTGYRFAVTPKNWFFTAIYLI